jgi:hypothetical protein
MASINIDIPWTREVCSRDIENIQDGRIQIDGYAYGYQSEED